MDRLPLFLLRSLAILAIVWGGFAPAAQRAAAATSLCGSLSSDTILSLAGSPYEVCAAGVLVPAGRTLTVDPGVTLRFLAGVGDYLTVQGTLVALGTISQGITLTGVSASSGSWGGISASGTALNPAQVSLDYANINYGGYAGSSGAALYADQAVVSITHSQVANSAGNGVFASIAAHLDAHTTNFAGNAQNAIQLNQPSTSLLMTELSAINNGTDGVRLVGTSTFHGVKNLAYPGIPYIVDGPLFNDLGDELTIDPGNTLKFTPQGWLYIRGRLIAVGTPDQPILLTGLTQAAGSWPGLYIDGGVHQAVAQLDYVTLEYAGSGIGGANIEVANGRLNVHHSIIRHSATDGVRFDSNWGGSILESQILDNADHGVRNLTPGRAVLATNNWWGDANGPQSDVAGCSTGLGNKVSSGVLFKPALPTANTTAVLPLSSAPILTITPRRWFAPADGVTRVYFDITLRDGNGAAVPGRTVKISASLGTTFDGGLTDQTGKTLAYLTSPTIGDATVTAALTPLTACDGALSPETKVTFTAPVTGTDLLPNAPASYFDGDIQVSPLPVITGVPTTISAKLTNPTPTAITVDVSFGFAQSGIGLVFGPIDDIVGKVIPANSSVTLSALFHPVVSGHYCFEVTYTITAIGSLQVNQAQGPGSGSRRLNINAWQGSMGPPSSKDALNKADKAFKLVSKLPSGPTQIQKGILGQWWGAMKDAASGISKGLGFDPPRQDYNQVTMPVWHPIPTVQSGPDITPARAAALNAVNISLTEIEGYGTAATTAMDRYGGATEANNLQWASEQANALLYYEEQLGTALLNYADHLDAFVLVLQTEAETAVNVSVSDVTDYQLRLSTTGFNTDEIAAAKSIGWSDAQIETYRQEILAANPNELAGSLLSMFTNEASVSRALGNALLHPPIFDTGFHVSAGSVAAGAVPAAAGNSMVQIYNTVATVQLSNPLAQAALIDVSARRIDLPADWSVSVTPAQVTLAPGEVTTLTVTILAGSPIPQGDHPRVAVEGYAGSVLLGGVVIETVSPYFQPFDGKLHLYLPMAAK